jgi:hypothetical protein
VSTLVKTRQHFHLTLSRRKAHDSRVPERERASDDPPGDMVALARRGAGRNRRPRVLTSRFVAVSNWAQAPTLTAHRGSVPRRVRYSLLGAEGEKQQQDGGVGFGGNRHRRQDRNACRIRGEPATQRARVCCPVRGKRTGVPQRLSGSGETGTVSAVPVSSGFGGTGATTHYVFGGGRFWGASTAAVGVPSPDN